ncbi:MAG: class I SAM-dependent methyltransferase [Wenzhouxiangellaceae bacterium]
MDDTMPMPRTPEPELMDAPEQVAAYARADFSASNQWFVDDLLTRYTPRPDAGTLVDLGCGPGDILIRLARSLPGWHIIGLDAGSNMLDEARRAITTAGLAESITLKLSQLPETGLEPGTFDCVVSNSLLHHLPDPMILWDTIGHLAAPGAWVHVMDLDRPASAERVEELLSLHAADAPEVLRTDFRNSLHAAWRAEEVQQQLRRAGLALGCRRVSDRHWLVSGRIG